MNLQVLIQVLSAIAADYTAFEAGSLVSAPTFMLDLSSLGIGKLEVAISAKKAV
jgi:hypothetical protein